MISNGAYDKAAAEVSNRLYPDRAKLDREEAKRLSLLDDHWDAIVVPAQN